MEGFFAALQSCYNTPQKTNHNFLDFISSCILTDTQSTNPFDLETPELMRYGEGNMSYAIPHTYSKLKVIRVFYFD
jgi:hypothetical protein